MTQYVLDTDHLSLYERRHPQVCDRILRSRQNLTEHLMVTVISVEEQYAGRLAQIRKASTSEALVAGYRRLQLTYDLFFNLPVLQYDFNADQKFHEFRSMGIWIGTQDLRIASIVLAHEGILLTRNLRDFEKVPGLRIEDWSV
ncbi:MAG: type II toxin-antitoxin system VapC family toxin [Oculatellaceae cyanobacterium Prado106]|nr:type II toxin-antitoxin system VapC family toxin [Oculatellaceae cyanobacterium Prado106]